MEGVIIWFAKNVNIHFVGFAYKNINNINHCKNKYYIYNFILLRNINNIINLLNNLLENAYLQEFNN